MNHQTLALAFVYFFVILVLIPAFCGDKVFSLYYHGDSEINLSIEKVKNKHRLARVDEYFKELNPSVSLLYHETKINNNLENLIVILAKKQNNDYNVLSQLVTELDKNIQEDVDHKTGMMICNISRSSYQELDYVSMFYPVKQGRNSTSWKLFNPEEIIKHDFVECLSLAVNTTSAKYITIISDRVVPYANFLYNLNHIIHTKLENYMYFGELYPKQNEPWLFLHLQEPVVFRKYTWSWTCLYELFMITVIGGVVFYLIFTLMDPIGQYSPSHNRLVITLFGALFFFTLALIIGRPYITELRRNAASLFRIYEAPEPVHFSGLNMPYTSAVMLVEHLSHLRCSVYVPFHEVLDQSINTLERPAYVVSPSLLRFVSPIIFDTNNL